MKPGVRAVGVAESFRGERSTLAGVVVRRDRVVDGLGFSTCTVGGTDATDAVLALLEDVVREDVRYVFLGAVAPAWYNLLDLSTLQEGADRPVIAVTFEASDGLEAGIREAFSGSQREERLARYRSLPPRRELSVDGVGSAIQRADGSADGGSADGETLYVRAVGIDDCDAAAVVRAFTPEGGRPEPLRVARLAARAGDSFSRRRSNEAASHRSDSASRRRE